MTQRAIACAFWRMVRDVVKRVKVESLSLGFITVLLISWCGKNLSQTLVMSFYPVFGGLEPSCPRRLCLLGSPDGGRMVLFHTWNFPNTLKSKM